MKYSFFLSIRTLIKSFLLRFQIWDQGPWLKLCFCYATSQGTENLLVWNDCWENKYKDDDIKTILRHWVTLIFITQIMNKGKTPRRVICWICLQRDGREVRKYSYSLKKNHPCCFPLREIALVITANIVTLRVRSRNNSRSLWNLTCMFKMVHSLLLYF